MRWNKKGLIFDPRGKFPWAHNYALQPTPLLLNDEIIRIYSGFRDEKGVSRVGFVDVEAANPANIVGISPEPVLDIGIDGAFDENGVVPCAVIRHGERVYLYYAGYQLGYKVKFFVFGGLAISDDGGVTFTRYSRVPITDRTDAELFFRVIHSVIYEDNVFKAWYGAGYEFVTIDGKKYPKYNIRYMESPDGINFGTTFETAIDFANTDEYRVARPQVIKHNGVYKMYYYIATISSGFVLGYAESTDGITWVRKDREIGIGRSDSGWDSAMIAYPSMLMHRDKVYMFYNGNNYGESGFGYAVLESW